MCTQTINYALSVPLRFNRQHGELLQNRTLEPNIGRISHLKMRGAAHDYADICRGDAHRHQPAGGGRTALPGVARRPSPTLDRFRPPDRPRTRGDGADRSFIRDCAGSSLGFDARDYRTGPELVR